MRRLKNVVLAAALTPAAAAQVLEPVPQARLDRHLAAPSTAAAPVLAERAGVAHWLGASWRGGAPGHTLDGSVAFYYLGPERDPQVDIRRAAAEGKEAALADRLLELRWYDAEARALRRWVDPAAAARWGLDEEDLAALLPLPQATNTLYF